MTRLIPILLIFVTHLAFGQITSDLILTQEQNDIWISAITKAPTARRLTLLRDRILADTNVYVWTRAPDRIKIGDKDQSSKKQESFGRPLIILGGQCDNYYLNISNVTEGKSLLLLASFLKTQYIEKIAIHTGDRAMSIYGFRAIAGVFVLVVRKKSTCRYLRAIDFGTW